MLKVLPIASSIAREADIKHVVKNFRDLYPELKLEEAVNDENKAEVESAGSEVMALIITGGTERIIGACKKSARSFVAIYHDSLNSMPAALEASAEFGFKAFHIKDQEEIKSYAKAVEIAEEMRSERLLLFGDPSPWLVYSGYGQNPESMIEKVEQQEIEELIELARTAKVKDEEISEIRSRAESIGPSFEDFRTSLKIEKAIRKMLEQRGTKFFSIKCFDLLEPLKGTACLALSRLNDEGYVAACEGDIAASVTMLLLSKASGLPSFMGNVESVNDRSIFLAHCTSPTKMLSGFKYMTHFESGMGVGIAGKIKEGETITVARVDTKKKIIRAGIGKVLSEPFREDVCRTQVRVELENPSLVVERPIGNHYALTLGNHVKVLENFSYVEGYEFERI
ncbi:MAG: L-arabinose isomerase family protein [Nitrososphaeria archaeon]